MRVVLFAILGLALGAVGAADGAAADPVGGIVSCVLSLSASAGTEQPPTVTIGPSCDVAILT